MATAVASSSYSSLLGGITSLPGRATLKATASNSVLFGLSRTRNPGSGGRHGKLFVRSDGIRETIDRATKKDITKEEILQNQQANESEKESVLGTKPTSGSLYPRPEVERRPETGDRSLGSLFAVDGPAPETINGRLAMVGMVAALVAERTGGQTVFEQLYVDGTGLGLYVLLVPLIAYASVVPMLNGESTDARSFGPFTARAERWSGRTAMLGFLSLLLIEQFTHTPVFQMLF